ncbi:MAG TPA: hypothetical protein VNR70_03940 [Steroidobacteraceae bacterium]|nr:hypothetical protein [Steroidobacteraceae bacterium]
MNTAFKLLRWPVMWSAMVGMATAGMAAGGIAAAQEPTPSAAPAAAPDVVPPAPRASKTPSKSKSAQIDAGEPRANTSPGSTNTPAAATPPGTQDSSTAVAGAPGVGTPTAPSAPGTAARPPAAGRAASPPGPPGPGPKAPGAMDRLDLGTATVTGDREQPKVMYIVPWKKSDIGDLSGKPMNSLLDEALAPVDRDEFKREVVYYEAVRANTPQNGASKATKQVEK